MEEIDRIGFTHYIGVGDGKGAAAVRDLLTQVPSDQESTDVGLDLDQLGLTSPEHVSSGGVTPHGDAAWTPMSQRSKEHPHGAGAGAGAGVTTTSEDERLDKLASDIGLGRRASQDLKQEE